jgi:pimeloyl-ACP methyl ester carboxylesterase
MRRLAFPFAMICSLPLATAGGALATGTPEPVASTRIAWRACATVDLPTKECSELTVPLDYDEPGGPTISIAVSRLPATSQAARIGSLFLNPGGPGGSGVYALPVQYAALPAALRERFDVVGFDPRGVGLSAPVQCFGSIEESTAFNLMYQAQWIAPANPEDEAAALTAYEAMARGCGERNAETLPHLSTANVAQDLDRLRQAVGDEQLNYLGTSYGTYLGETYANMFPDRIRAMALDGTINPSSYTSFGHGDGEMTDPTTASFQRILSPQASSAALEEFFAQCATAGPETCAFADSTAEATRAKFDALMARLRAEPMIATGPAGAVIITYSLTVYIVFNALYATPAWPQLAEGLQRLVEDDVPGFIAAMPSLLGGPPLTEYPNGQEALWAINCVDTDNPGDPERYRENARAAEEHSPYFGALWAYYSLPCAFWPAQDEDRYEGPWDAETSATILIVSRVFDPATPHGGAIAAETTLGNARLLTIDGWGHGYYTSGQSTCANAAMAAYFIAGTLPAADTVCAEDSPPFGG